MGKKKAKARPQRTVKSTDRTKGKKDEWTGMPQPVVHSSISAWRSSAAASGARTASHSDAVSDDQMPRGLQNIGNTCFFNSALQSVLACLPPDAIIPCNGRISSAFACTVDAIYSAAGHSARAASSGRGASTMKKALVNPGALLAAISQEYVQFKGKRQQDANELYVVLMTSMKEEAIKAAATSAESESESNPEPVSDLQLNSSESTSLFTRPVHNISSPSQLFECFLGSTVTCSKCRSRTYRLEEQHAVSLQIPGSEHLNEVKFKASTGRGKAGKKGKEAASAVAGTQDTSAAAGPAPGPEKAQDTGDGGGAEDEWLASVLTIGIGADTATQGGSEAEEVDTNSDMKKEEDDVRQTGDLAGDRCSSNAQQSLEESLQKLHLDSPDPEPDPTVENSCMGSGGAAPCAEAAATAAAAASTPGAAAGAAERDAPIPTFELLAFSDVSNGSVGPVGTGAGAGRGHAGAHDGSDAHLTLPRCLAAFTADEELTISSGNAFYCNSCAAFVDATRRLRILAPPPPILCFHLKRLLPAGKFSDFVKFPVCINVGRFCCVKVPTNSSAQGKAEGAGIERGTGFPTQSQPQTQTPNQPQLEPSIWYQIVAVVVHQGSAFGGHYVAYVRRHMKPATQSEVGAEERAGESTDATAGSGEVVNLAANRADCDDPSKEAPSADANELDVASKLEAVGSRGDENEADLGVAGGTLISQQGAEQEAESSMNEAECADEAHDAGNGSTPTAEDISSGATGDERIQKETSEETQALEPLEEADDDCESDWFYTSDSTVRRCTLQEVLSQQAYMLFYEKRRGHAPRRGKEQDTTVAK